MKKMQPIKAILVLTLLFTNQAFSQFEARDGKGIPTVVKEEGQKLFESTCAACHTTNTGVKSTPSTRILSAMTARTVYSALTTGKMKLQAVSLSDNQIKAISQFITNQALVETVIPKEAFTKFSLPKKPAILSGWGGNLEGTGFQKSTSITKENVGALKVKWVFGFPDGTQVRSKPAIIGDWLIVGTQFGEVYAIHKNTGKIGWIYRATSAIRGGIAIDQSSTGVRVYFADYSTNVYALSVAGKEIWKVRTGIHPQSGNTGTVAVYNNTVFVPLTSYEVASARDPNYACCTSSGELVALNATNGQIKWRHRVIAEEPKEAGKKTNGQPFYGPSGAIVWCSPTIDTKRNLIYIGTGENYTNPATNTSDAIQAIDITTGKLKWNFQGTSHDTWNGGCPGNPNCPDKEGPDLDFGMAPLLVKKEDGQDILVVGQKSGVVHALEPATGKVIWQKRVGKGGLLGGIHWGMATDGKRVYVANADNVYAINKQDSTLKPSPGIYALNLTNGEIVWKNPTPPAKGRSTEANSAAPLVSSDLVFAGALDGFIRAYHVENGVVLWEFDTVKSFTTSNGIAGKGGSLDGSSPTIIDNMLFVNSGYGIFGEIPGNVLIAFELEKK